jgi:hypothetical protein
VTAGDDHLLRNVTREVLVELLPGLLEEALTAPATAGGNGNGHSPAAQAAEPATVPQVPAPPVAAVHRPPGWQPAEGGTAVEADPLRPPPETSSPPAEDESVERVDLHTDADLDAFVRSLARRLENPRDRMAILSGRLRFRLAATSAARSDAAVAAPVMRVEKGAVTERHVREAAEKRARLVLSPRAVLTPMARDRARSLGVKIEKERRC